MDVVSDLGREHKALHNCFLDHLAILKYFDWEIISAAELLFEIRCRCERRV
jgi:hypothetical protein